MIRILITVLLILITVFGKDWTWLKRHQPDWKILQYAPMSRANSITRYQYNFFEEFLFVADKRKYSSVAERKEEAKKAAVEDPWTFKHNNVQDELKRVRNEKCIKQSDYTYDAELLKSHKSKGDDRSTNDILTDCASSLDATPAYNICRFVLVLLYSVTTGSSYLASLHQHFLLAFLLLVPCKLDKHTIHCWQTSRLLLIDSTLSF